MITNFAVATQALSKERDLVNDCRNLPRHVPDRIITAYPLRRNEALIRERRRHADVGQHDIRVVFLDRTQQAVEALGGINQLDGVNPRNSAATPRRTR